MSKTHFATCDRANESDNNDYWSDPLCATYGEDLKLTNDPKEITCKKCQKTIGRFIVQLSEAASHF